MVLLVFLFSPFAFSKHLILSQEHLTLKNLFQPENKLAGCGAGARHERGGGHGGLCFPGSISSAEQL